MAEALIQPFINYLKFEKRYSQHTVISYTNDLTSFFSYLQSSYGEIGLGELSHIYIRSWLASLKEDELKAKTLNRKISTLRSFFKYQLRMGIIKQSPMAKVTAPKNEKRLPSFVASDDVKKLFNYDLFPDNYKGRTERLLMLIFYNTGMRLSEVINLRLDQVSRHNTSLKILGKGNKERIVPISVELLKEIDAYCLDRNKNEIVDSAFILLNEKGKKLASRSVYDIVKKYLSAVTTIEKRSPHILRHSFATHLTNNGADINAVKELLGHNSLASTQVYTHNTIDRLKEAYKKAHPKA